MSRRPELGFQDDGALLTPGAARSALLDEMKKAGATRLRANAVWGQVFKNGGYDWSALDSLVNDARARGIKPQLTLVGTPRYMAGKADERLSWRHADPAVAGRFAQDAAQHFKGRVDRYSAWNEPNLDTFLADRSAKRYRALYQAMRQGIRGVDPHAQVMLGELMPGNSHDPSPKDSAHAANFLQRMFAAGNRPLRAEGLALHPYGFGGEAAGGHGGPDTYLGINQLRQAQRLLATAQRRGQLQTNRGGRVPLYLTEYGISRDAVRDPARRAGLLARAQRAARQAGARELVYYQMRPSAHGSGWDTATDPRHVRAALARMARR